MQLLPGLRDVIIFPNGDGGRTILCLPIPLLIQAPHHAALWVTLWTGRSDSRLRGAALLPDSKEAPEPLHLSLGRGRRWMPGLLFDESTAFLDLPTLLGPRNCSIFPKFFLLC